MFPLILAVLNKDYNAGMFLLILTALNEEDYNRGYYDPYEGLFV